MLTEIKMSLISKYLKTQTEAAPLAAFRILFGVMMTISIIRFWANGWIEKLYLEPAFHFSYYGFEWVKPIGDYTYLIFAICALAAAGIALGLWYRLSAVLFFLSFTYIELMDKTTYLNHYYFISILSFVLIFLPAHSYFSIDARSRPRLAFQRVPRVYIDVIKALMCLIYFYAGLAKLNSDWLLHAQPLSIWLPGRYDLPIIGGLMEERWVHYTFSWAGALYDLSIPFLLLYRPTRVFAFALVVIFHVLTRVLFPIGMFPFIMIVSATIFFSSGFHHRFLTLLAALFRIPKNQYDNLKSKPATGFFNRIGMGVLSLVLILQLLLPWRYLLYPGELFWHEQGFRFSWRVMLMEKAGYANFKIVDPQRNESFVVDNQKFLTPFQEKQMSFQPDFMLEYAHWLEKHFQETENRGDLQVYAEAYVALNGRSSRLYLDPAVDLTTQKRGFAHKTWILPFNDTIYGL